MKLDGIEGSLRQLQWARTPPKASAALDDPLAGIETGESILRETASRYAQELSSLLQRAMDLVATNDGKLRGPISLSLQ
jgi:hypothetical protein